jgi:diguanylate cyclase (GGDEF)-like protein
VKILVADDDPVSRRALEGQLAKWGCEFTTASDGESAWRVLQDIEAPRLAILDWTMPGLDGLEICRRLRQDAREPYTYILLLTAHDDKQDVVQGLEAGADDYLTKPFDAGELKARLRVGRRTLAILDSLLSARDALRYQGGVDPLTGLMTRSAAVEALCREIARGARRRSSLAVILADLDEFDLLNRAYGNLAGDAVLRETACRLRSRTRVFDVMGRYESHQFITVLCDCDLEASRKCAERFHQTVSAPFTGFAEGRIQLTATLGLAAAGGSLFPDGDASQQAGSLLCAAEAALRRAKLGGKGRTEIATPLEFLLSFPAISPRASSRLSRDKN